jgi:protein-disulfide isomerase
MSGAPVDPRPSADTQVSFTFPRTHLYAAVGVLVGLGAGFFLGRTTRPAPTPVTVAAAPAPAPPPAAAAPDSAALARALDVRGRAAWGPADPAVTVVEFTDYQCPFCRQFAASVLPAIRARYGDRVRYVVKNYPIPQLHPLATGAAEAAECAADQGRFWPYHDRLFVAAALDRAGLEREARAADLDVGRFRRCLDDGTSARRVRDDVEAGNAVGVSGTPTFFVNGQRIQGAAPVETFAQILDAALAAGPR